MNLHIANRPPEPTLRLFDVAELDRMIAAGIVAADERVELLDGELVWMAATMFRHHSVHMRLLHWMAERLGRAFHVGAAGSLRLGPTTLVEPDILIARQEALLTSSEGFLELAPADILLIVEIADTTLAFDLTRKAGLYARHGAAEYWVVDARTLTTHVHREPSPDGYGSVTAVAADEVISPLAPALAPLRRALASLA
jgi:Uma2 family endonuclease